MTGNRWGRTFRVAGLREHFRWYVRARKDGGANANETKLLETLSIRGHGNHAPRYKRPCRLDGLRAVATCPPLVKSHVYSSERGRGSPAGVVRPILMPPSESHAGHRDVPEGKKSRRERL